MSAKPRIDYLGLLREVAVATNKSNSPEDALKVALDLLCETAGWPVGHALTRASDGTLWPTGIWHVVDPKMAEDFSDFRQITEAQHFSQNVGLPSRVLVDGQPKWIADVEGDGNFPRRALDCEARLASGFAFPLRAGAKIVGVFEFFTRVPQPLDAEFLGNMVQVGAQIGCVFERLRAHKTAIADEQHTRELLDSALDSVRDAFIGIDASERIIAWNKAAASTFGWPRNEAIGRILSETIIPHRYRKEHKQGIKRFLATGIPRVIGKQRETSALHREGHEFPIEITYWWLKGENGINFYAFARDITARKERERELERQAYYDALTGLPNRELLLDRLEQLLARRDCPQQGPAVLFVDLDRFKCINDSLGHSVGDRVLVIVAKRLRQAVRPMDTVARLSGDEFLVVCPAIHAQHNATAIAERVLAALAKPIPVGSEAIFLTASVGVAIADEGSDGEALIGAADAAMYRAKGSGRGQYELFDEQMLLGGASRLRTENELRAAVEREQLRLHFQPIVTAAEESPVAVEALLRWEHPERGLLLPKEFISIAEDTGLITPVGAWVVEEACRCAQRWETDSDVHIPLCVSINLSARQLMQPDLVPMMERILASAAIDPAQIQFGIEVTESVMMRDPAAAAKTLTQLKALGVHLAIDDFGTGHSSLAYLKHFPVDIIKLDQSFVRGVPTDPTDLAIVHAVIQLAHSLGLSVVAEGVETVTQAQALRGTGVDLMQGFLYARPQPPEDLQLASAEIKRRREASR